MKWEIVIKTDTERRQCKDLWQRGVPEEGMREAGGESPRLGSAMQNWRKSRSRMKSRNEISLVRCWGWPHGTCSGAARTLEKKERPTIVPQSKKKTATTTSTRTRTRASPWCWWWCTSFQSLLVALVQAATDDKHVEHNNGNASCHAHQQHARCAAQWGLAGRRWSTT